MTEEFKIDNINIFFLVLFPTLISYLVLPFVKKFAHKFIFLDRPGPRKLHKKPVANIGGIVIYFSFLVGLFFLEKFTDINLLNFRIILVISFIIFLNGLIDDFYNLSVKIRLTLQFLLASFIYSKGINISTLNLDFLNLNINYFELPKIISYFITTFWIVGVTNAINWIDGINGLASGVVILILIGIAKIAITKDLIGLFFITLILCGSCLGFLIHNLKPNNIIMGDNGSNFLGFNISILSLYASSNADLFNTNFSINPFIPIFLLAYPLIDMTRVILNRIKKGGSPFLPDNDHFHHLLLKKGFSNRSILIIAFLSTIYFILWTFIFIKIKLAIPFIILSTILLLFLILFRKKFIINN